MRLLAFDTSTDWISVAVSDGDEWHLHAERVAQDNSRRILPIISRTLAEAGFTLQALDGIAFGAGPGAFTGVRIACGIAQGLAFAIDRPVVGVSTLEALAHEAFRVHGAKRVVACLDARMREIYAACYVREQDEWRVADQRSLHAFLSALIASSRTRFHSSSTLSTNGLARKMSLSFLSKRVSTVALMRPGRADITTTRSAR